MNAMNNTKTTSRIFDITITATQEQRLNAVHHCLCNSGFGAFRAYGLNLDWHEDHYEQAKRTLLSSGDFDAESLCGEDVWLQMLKDGNRILVHDAENDDVDPELVGELSLATIEANWSAIRQSDLLELYHEEDDADTADCILQTLCFGSIVYG